MCWFDQAEFQSQFQQYPVFHQKTKPPSIPLHLFEQIPSTTPLVWDLLEKGEKPPFAVIAKEQTAGKGQWGRKWESHPDGLYLSVALTPQIPATHGIHLTLATAWGIAHHLREISIPVTLKWLNDLLLAGCKLGGIKIETAIAQERITTAVVGVGINWKNQVPLPGITLSSFLQEAQSDSIQTLAQLTAITLSGLLFGYETYLGEGIESILSGYLSYFPALGQEITVQGMTGVITGITPAGELQLRLSSPGATTELKIPPGTFSLGYESDGDQSRQRL